MSTKNIALDSEVYRRLAHFKQESESFSRAVSRLLQQAELVHTGAEILARLRDLPPLSSTDAEAMLESIEQGRRTERWDLHDLR